MLIYERHNSTNPTGLTGPSPGGASEHIQPANRPMMSYDRLRDQAFKTQCQSYVSRRIQPDMPNDSPNCIWPFLLPALDSTCSSCPDGLVGKNPGLLPPSSFSRPEMSSLGCLFTTPGLVHLRRPPVHTCTKA